MLSICYCLICLALRIIIICDETNHCRQQMQLQTEVHKTHDVQLELDNFDTEPIFLRLSGCYCDMELQWYCVLYRKVVALSGTSMECRMAALTRYIT